MLVKLFQPQTSQRPSLGIHRNWHRHHQRTARHRLWQAEGTSRRMHKRRGNRKEATFWWPFRKLNFNFILHLKDVTLHDRLHSCVKEIWVQNNDVQQFIILMLYCNHWHERELHELTNDIWCSNAPQCLMLQAVSMKQHIRFVLLWQDWSFKLLKSVWETFLETRTEAVFLLVRQDCDRQQPARKPGTQANEFHQWSYYVRGCHWPPLDHHCKKKKLKNLSWIENWIYSRYPKNLIYLNMSKYK